MRRYVPSLAIAGRATDTVELVEDRLVTVQQGWQPAFAGEDHIMSVGARRARVATGRPRATMQAALAQADQGGRRGRGRRGGRVIASGPRIPDRAREAIARYMASKHQRGHAEQPQRQPTRRPQQGQTPRPAPSRSPVRRAPGREPAGRSDTWGSVVSTEAFRLQARDGLTADVQQLSPRTYIVTVSSTATTSVGLLDGLAGAAGQASGSFWGAITDLVKTAHVSKWVKEGKVDGNEVVNSGTLFGGPNPPADPGQPAQPQPMQQPAQGWSPWMQQPQPAPGPAPWGWGTPTVPPSPYYYHPSGTWQQQAPVPGYGPLPTPGVVPYNPYQQPVQPPDTTVDNKSMVAGLDERIDLVDAVRQIVMHLLRKGHVASMHADEYGNVVQLFVGGPQPGLARVEALKMAGRLAADHGFGIIPARTALELSQPPHHQLGPAVVGCAGGCGSRGMVRVGCKACGGGCGA